MALKDTIATLKSVAKDAKALFDALKPLASGNKDAKAADKNKLAALTDKLDASARKAAKEHLAARIKELDAAIRSLDLALTVPSLTTDTRQQLRGERMKKVAARGRLKGRLALDFGGMLSKGTTDELAALAKRVNSDVARKKKAASFMNGALKVADLALSIATKLAM